MTYQEYLENLKDLEREIDMFHGRIAGALNALEMYKETFELGDVATVRRRRIRAAVSVLITSLEAL